MDQDNDLDISKDLIKSDIESPRKFTKPEIDLYMEENPELSFEESESRKDTIWMNKWK